LLTILINRQYCKIKKEQAENDIIFLKRLIADDEKILRSVIYEKIDFVKKIVAPEQYTQAGTKVDEKQRKTDTANHEMIIKSINRLDKNYYNDFKNKYPKLEYIEIIICFMLLLGFENNGISALLKLSVNTIQQREVEIRKKAGIKPRGNIKLFFEENIQTTSKDMTTNK